MELQYINKKKFIVNVIYFFLIILLAYVVMKYAITLIGPFIFAFIIAFILKKPAKAISSRIKVPHKLVSFSLVLIFYSTVGVLISLISLKLISTVTKVIYQIPSIYENQLIPFLTSTFYGIEKAVYRLDPALVKVLNDGFNQLVNSLGENITNTSLALVGSLSDIASSFPAFLIKILLMVISTFFIAMDFDVLTSFILRQFSHKGNEIIQTIMQYMVNTLFVVIRSYIIIMSITFIELSIGLSIIGIPNAILIAFLIALFDILPVLGTGGIMIPWVIFTIFQGDYKIAFALLAVYVFITIIRNILEPKIVGKQLGLHPVVALMSMFIGANLVGIIGLFGFPIILSLLKHLNDKGLLKMFK
ncbi:sporulation integral membrane protein YtvI [Alkaliphilus serpentinus]|uniref:Sporulation integral membrane protein YtvI n=1 Tax=Alkaliphilus serpentinus TaxID=1482731 RepID=A0A833HRA5_9FIRM|nr:sporulation integral membrane protein YtvI [Alkaliphilus serpentinus]KAB3531781.1 sporulation integral membrane protein YtvI [Alkaliphilus serpentinus]